MDFLIASDIPAILKYTNKYILLNDNEIIKINNDYQVYQDNKIITKDILEFNYS